MRALVVRAPLFGVYIRAADCWKLAKASHQVSGGVSAAPLPTGFMQLYAIYLGLKGLPKIFLWVLHMYYDDTWTVWVRSRGSGL